MALVTDIKKLEADTRELVVQVDSVKSQIARHEEQISGERGISSALVELKEEVKGLRRALYTAGGGFILAAIGFGFAALQVAGTV